MADEAEVLFEKRGALGLITLNRPKALNALTQGMCVAMKAQLDQWAADPAVKTVVIRGNGERAFCAGGDIRALYESGKAKTPYALDFWRDEYILNATIKHYPKPYVALIHGIDMGGGVGVSVNGSHRIAGESMVFAMPETGIGLFPDVGGSYFLPRCPGQIGMYLGLTGARLRTTDALYAGIATHFVQQAKWDALIEKLAGGAAPEDALNGLTDTVPDTYLLEHRATIDRIFALDSVEAIVAALDAEETDWGDDTAKTLRAKSPTSLKIAFRQIREGAKLEFDECMRMEYRLVNRIVAGHDFYEGVRAVIIDKGNAPKWQPADLADVKDSDVDEYFAPLPADFEAGGLLFKKVIEIDASKWKSVSDLYNSFFEALGCPHWHDTSINALLDSMASGGINAIEAPYTIVVRGTTGIREEVRNHLDEIVAAFAEDQGKAPDIKFEVRP